MKFKLIYFLVLLPYIGQAQAINESFLKKQVYFFAADNMKGRGTGSAENAKAAKHIAAAFKEYGLQPLGTDGYDQPFTAVVRRVIVKDSIRQARNVLGFLNNGAAKTIVIGAHYDHLGLGTQGSSKDTLPEGKIHNGADDNASGSAGLLALARYYSSNSIKESFNLLFIAFGSEELGLLGSKHFVTHPTLPLANIHFMLNMDMIGRYDSSRGLGVGGVGTAPEWTSVFDQINKKDHIKFYTDRNGKGGSDQHSFYMQRVPVVFLHTGGHDDYHKPTDDADKVDYAAMVKILQLGITIIDGAMKQPQLNFTETN